MMQPVLAPKLRRPFQQLLRACNRWQPLPSRWMLSILRKDAEREVTTSGWARLRDSSDRWRHAVMRAYAQHLHPEGHVLDVGCGEGILQEGLGYRAYLGLDSEPSLISRARAKKDERTRFFCADVQAYTPTGPFDIIFFSECLYYLDDPLEVVQRCHALLSPDGVMVISMYHYLNLARRIWRRLDRAFPLEAVAKVTNATGKAWMIKVYR